MVSRGRQRHNAGVCVRSVGCTPFTILTHCPLCHGWNSRGSGCAAESDWTRGSVAEGTFSHHSVCSASRAMSSCWSCARMLPSSASCASSSACAAAGVWLGRLARAATCTDRQQRPSTGKRLTWEAHMYVCRGRRQQQPSERSLRGCHRCGPCVVSVSRAAGIRAFGERGRRRPGQG